MAIPKMSQAQVDASLILLPAWAQAGESIQRTFQFKDFVEAMRFVGEIARSAEQVQHHPDMLIRYSKVTLTYATHDANGITQKDLDAAKFADALATQFEAPKAAKPAPKVRAARASSGASKAGVVVKLPGKKQ